MSAILLGIAKSLMTEFLFRRIFVVAGDLLVESTKNELDNQLWEPVRQALEGKK